METKSKPQVNRKELAKQLRASHFSLGNDSKFYNNNSKIEENFKSSSRAEYSFDPGHFNLQKKDKIEMNKDRKSNLKLGEENERKFITSSMEQNGLIERNKGKETRVSLNSQVKSDLRASHFSFGHGPIEYSSISSSNYYDKSKMINKREGESNLGESLRQQNYNLGSSKLDYISEAKMKFASPERRPEDR